MRTVIIIPSRYDSTRLPGKPLLDVGGEPMIVRVWRRCRLVKEAHEVIVATDDRRIRDAVLAAGGAAVMTSAAHPSGTDRIAEASASIDCDLVVNVQGDEPFIEPSSLDLLIASFARRGDADAATLAAPITSRQDLLDPAVVKVVVNRRGEAIYFSRYPVPYSRDLWENEGQAWQPARPDADVERDSPYLRHVGTYAYRKDFLARFTRWQPGRAETMESLEQLRILEEGERIRVVVVSSASGGVDTPEDLARAREAAEAESEI